MLGNQCICTEVMAFSKNKFKDPGSVLGTNSLLKTMHTQKTGEAVIGKSLIVPVLAGQYMGCLLIKKRRMKMKSSEKI